MAKKKKHRKTRRQKIEQTQKQQHTSAVVIDKAVSLDSKIVKPDKHAKAKSIEILDDGSFDYVKKDVRRSLVLTGVILVVFAVFYVVLEKTSAGAQVLTIIKL
ncbi:hypothetical protein H0W80_04085 [Candidatus Saccharibacteria bacterium]|nr:hypothetical protein [Candidatus Saccharibacteria bacterium]